MIIIPRAISEENQRQLIRASLEQYILINETNLHSHYLIPSSGIWELYRTGNAQLIPPRASELGSNTSYEPNMRGPRRLIENRSGDVKESLKASNELKLPSAPSLAAKPKSAAELLPRLRWANLGHSYHWGSKSYDFSKQHPPLPQEVREICRSLVSGVDWDDLWSKRTEEVRAGLNEEDWRDWSDNYGGSMFTLAVSHPLRYLWMVRA